jgi:hypothetical protein
MPENPEDAIERLIKEAMPDSIVTHFVAVVEVTEGTTQELRLAMSEGMSPWLANGMLLGAARMIDSFDDNGDELDFLDDDDDDDF